MSPNDMFNTSEKNIFLAPTLWLHTSCENNDGIRPVRKNLFLEFR